MKLVREHIFEKFADESDPIKDMGIGSWVRKIQDVFEKHIGKVDIKVVGDADKYPTIYIFIPYKNTHEKLEVKNFLQGDNNVLNDILDILYKNKKDLWNRGYFKSKSFKNKVKFHNKERGYVVYIITANYNLDDPEAEF